MRYLCFVLFLGVCFGQTATPPVIPLPKFTLPTPVKPVAPPAPANAVPATAQPPATGDELKFLRFLLTNVASLDHSPDAVKAYEESFVMPFGLSTQESATIHSAGLTLNTVLAELRQSTQTLVAGKTALAPSDVTALASLNAQREQQIATLANQILNSVSGTPPPASGRPATFWQREPAPPSDRR